MFAFQAAADCMTREDGRMNAPRKSQQRFGTLHGGIRGFFLNPMRMILALTSQVRVR